MPWLRLMLVLCPGMEELVPALTTSWHPGRRSVRPTVFGRGKGIRGDMKRVIRRIENKFWSIVLVYASIPVFVVLLFKTMAAIAWWLLALEVLLIGGYVTFRIYRYLLRS
jgi:hypothetical protein